MTRGKNTPGTCLIIPVYNGGEPFEKCLRSVRELAPQPDEIIVVDDGGSDGSAQSAREAGCRLVRRDSPGGPAGARNAGAAQTRADILIFLDADTSAGKSFVADAVELLAHDPGPAAIIGSYDDSPGDPGFFSQFRNLLHHYIHQTSSQEAVTFWGACGAIKREVFLEMGGFDESLRYLEDVELGLRLVRKGHRIRLAKHWQVKHWKAFTAWSFIKTDIMHRALPWTRLAVRGHGLINDLNTRFGNRISVALSLLIPCLAAAAFFTPWAWPALLSALGILVFVNRGFYAFLARRKTLRFAICAVFWHWLHYLAGGIGLGLGILEHLVARPGKRKAFRSSGQAL